MTLDLLYVLDWAIIALSFFNTIVFVWLGLTVLLNAERRHAGTWAAGGGLILGGLFFAGHTSVVGHDITSFGPDVEFWWRVSWLPVVGAPYTWYLVALWYTGVLRAGRHRAWLALVTLLGLAALLSLVVANPLPSYSDVLNRTPVPIFRIAGLPAAMLVYPIYSTLCIALSLSALRHPEASERFMGDEASRRARPWLIAASLVLLAVALALCAAVAIFLSRVEARLTGDLPSRTLVLMMGFDVLIVGLITVAIVLIGQAIVAYEIFTGKALPRGGLARYWRRGLVLAGGYGALMGLSLSLPGVAGVDPIYRLLLATLLMTLFYALLSWRSYVDRERSMEHLRPFVASQQLYERMLRPLAPPEVDIAEPFRALCADVLGARVAYLAALGPLAPLVGPGLAYPDEAESQEARAKNQEAPDGSRLTLRAPVLGSDALLADLTAQFRSPQAICVPLDAAKYGGAVWAVPLWSERGLIGVLLLGEKRDGGLYTQEEIEIGRATGERLIDSRASAELALRLTALQRQRLADSQVVDQRTRRTLHDDVLPQLHTAMLVLEARGLGLGARDADTSLQPPPASLNVDDVVALLSDVHRQIANLLHAMPAAAAPEVARLGLLGALQQAIDGEFGGDFDAVDWQIAPEVEQSIAAIPALAAEVCFYAAREVVRNAARYGRNGDAGRALHLTVSAGWRGGLELAIEDDGVGLGAATATHGGGHGLGLHSTLMAVVGGTLTAESQPGAFTRIVLALPQAAWG
jgi:signal transduction histidine kinase